MKSISIGVWNVPVGGNDGQKQDQEQHTFQQMLIKERSP